MNNFSSLIENSKRAVRYWWLLLIIGIALFVVGILIFVYPTQSYLGMSLVFGWLMLFSGILEVVLSSANKHFITGRGWMLAGGIIEIILGIFDGLKCCISSAGDNADDRVARNTVGRGAFRGVQYTESARGAGADVENPATVFQCVRHCIYALRNRFERLRHSEGDGFVLLVDEPRNFQRAHFINVRAFQIAALRF